MPKGESPQPDLSKHSELFAAAYGSKGLERAREKKWDRAQAAFARACAYANNDGERQNWLNFLYCAIRDELNAPKTNRESQPPEEDLRLTLSPALQADIWAARGKVLESMGRLTEAANAYAEAFRLSPETEAYSAEAARIRRDMANRYRPTASPDVYPAELACPSLTFHHHQIVLAPSSRLSPPAGR